MRTILLAVLAGVVVLPLFQSPARSQELASEVSVVVSENEATTYLISPANASPTLSRYSTKKAHSQRNCSVAWCAPNFQLSLIDSEGQSLVPGRLSGYTHLRVNQDISSVVLKNDHPHRVMVLFSINSKNPLDGKRTIQSSQGYVVPAQSELVVDKTSLPGVFWFSDDWPQQGHIHINVHAETHTRPIDGGPPPHAPAYARDYITDEKGKRFWVPPHDFVFRHAQKDFSPSAKIYMTYDIQHAPDQDHIEIGQDKSNPVFSDANSESEIGSPGMSHAPSMK